MFGSIKRALFLDVWLCMQWHGTKPMLAHLRMPSGRRYIRSEKP